VIHLSQGPYTIKRKEMDPLKKGEKTEGKRQTFLSAEGKKGVSWEGKNGQTGDHRERKVRIFGTSSPRESRKARVTGGRKGSSLIASKKKGERPGKKKKKKRQQQHTEGRKKGGVW